MVLWLLVNDLKLQRKTCFWRGMNNARELTFARESLIFIWKLMVLTEDFMMRPFRNNDLIETGMEPVVQLCFHSIVWEVAVVLGHQMACYYWNFVDKLIMHIVMVWGKRISSPVIVTINFFLGNFELPDNQLRTISHNTITAFATKPRFLYFPFPCSPHPCLPV